MHAYPGTSLGPAHTASASEEQKTTHHPIIGHIPKTVEDYLLDLFWTNYNNTFPFVDKELFLQAKEEENPNYFSWPLYACLLAVGFRFADMTRQGMLSLLVGSGRETKPYLAAKRLVEEELESSKSLPLVQALLLLGDLEGALGRYNTGWMYIGEHVSHLHFFFVFGPPLHSRHPPTFPPVHPLPPPTLLRFILCLPQLSSSLSFAPQLSSSSSFASPVREDDGTRTTG